jgi:hypothetical protein
MKIIYFYVLYHAENPVELIHQNANFVADRSELFGTGTGTGTGTGSTIISTDTFPYPLIFKHYGPRIGFRNGFVDGSPGSRCCARSTHAHAIYFGSRNILRM